MNDASLVSRHTEGTEPRTFGDHMRIWRRIRGMSQLQLSLRAEVSARHVSFLESGRARPSRQMVETLADALDIPLRARNPLLLTAGFAPAYTDEGIEAPDAGYLRHVLEVVLKGSDPFPALVLDRTWHVLMSNKAGKTLLAMCGAEAKKASLMELLLKPGPLKDAIVNWDEVVAETMKRVRREADHAGDETIYKLAESMLPKGWTPPRVSRASKQVPLLIPLHMRMGGVDLRFASIIASLGTPADIGIAELSIETFLPADEATEAILRAQAEPAAPAAT